MLPPRNLAAIHNPRLQTNHLTRNRKRKWLTTTIVKSLWQTDKPVVSPKSDYEVDCRLKPGCFDRSQEHHLQSVYRWLLRGYKYLARPLEPYLALAVDRINQHREH